MKALGSARFTPVWLFAAGAVLAACAYDWTVPEQGSGGAAHTGVLDTTTAEQTTSPGGGTGSGGGGHAGGGASTTATTGTSTGATTGKGGAGGATQTACDDASNCADCRGCALDGACHELYQACAASFDCIDFATCVWTCLTRACIDDCAYYNPYGAEEYGTVAACVVCDQCPETCADYASLAGCP